MCDILYNLVEVELLPSLDILLDIRDVVISVRPRLFVPEPYGVAQLMQQHTFL